MVAANQNRRIGPVDVIRTLAFSLVVLFHFVGMFGPRYCDWFVRYGSTGTDAFFLLSAFLLCTSLRRGSRWQDAVGRRLARIYPGFVAILLAYLALAPLAPHVTKLPQDPIAALFYLAANLLLLPGIAPLTPIVTVAWSLSYVVFGYILIGAVDHLIPERTQGRLRCAVWLAMSAAIWGASRFAGFEHGRLMFFPLGALVAEAAPYLSGVIRGRWIGTTMAIGLLLFAPGLGTRGAALATLATLWIVSPPSGLRVPSLFADVAELSYPVFLSHGLVLHAMARANTGGTTLADFAGTLLASLSLVLAGAMLFRAAVSDPLQGWLSQRARKAVVASKSRLLQAHAT
jgi:peptidoglycan/LPS O-acetylase OafA/YrhL